MSFFSGLGCCSSGQDAFVFLHLSFSLPWAVLPGLPDRAAWRHGSLAPGPSFAVVHGLDVQSEVKSWETSRTKQFSIVQQMFVACAPRISIQGLSPCSVFLLAVGFAESLA